MAKRSARKARSGGVSGVLERTPGAEYRIGGWHRAANPSGASEGATYGPEADQCCPMGEAIHHHHVTLDGVVTRGPTILVGDPTAFCDAGTVMSPHGYRGMRGIPFRLVGMGIDAATYARCLPLRGSFRFEGVLIHTQPTGPDGQCRGTYLGAGCTDILGTAWGTDDLRPLTAVIAFMRPDEGAPLSQGDALSLIERVGSRIGLPLGRAPAVHA